MNSPSPNVSWNFCRLQVNQRGQRPRQTASPAMGHRNTNRDPLLSMHPPIIKPPIHHKQTRRPLPPPSNSSSSSNNNLHMVCTLCVTLVFVNIAWTQQFANCILSSKQTAIDLLRTPHPPPLPLPGEALEAWRRTRIGSMLARLTGPPVHLKFTDFVDNGRNSGLVTTSLLMSVQRITRQGVEVLIFGFENSSTILILVKCLFWLTHCTVCACVSDGFWEVQFVTNI